MKHSVFDKISDFIFVNKCACCRKPSNMALCEECERKMKYLNSLCCEICGKPKKRCVCNDIEVNFDRCICTCAYENRAVSGLVYKLKHTANRKTVEFIASKMAAKIREEYGNIHFDYVTYLPTDKKSKDRKGFDHAEILAKSVSEEIGVEFSPPPIKHISKVKQKDLDKKERAKNAENMFASLNKTLNGNILLIDDIITTGSSLSAAAKMLKESGSEKVYAAVFATKAL